MTKKIYLLSFPDATAADVRQLTVKLRPIVEQFDLVLLTEKIKPASIDDLKRALQAHLEHLENISEEKPEEAPVEVKDDPEVRAKAEEELAKRDSGQ